MFPRKKLAAVKGKRNLIGARKGFSPRIDTPWRESNEIQLGGGTSVHPKIINYLKEPKCSRTKASK